MTFTPEKAREQFTALTPKVGQQSAIFFDGPGGSQVPVSVLEAMTHYLGHFNANLGGHYFSSQVTGDVMRQARESMQALLNAPSADNIVFGANMTSLTFQLSRAISREWRVGDEVVVTALDHYANASTWAEAAKDKGATVHQARVDESDCNLDLPHLLSLINTNTRLVAVTLASNTTGSIVDVQKVVAAAHQVGAAVYVDAVHYAPHRLVDVAALGCDFLVCSAYKFFGPHLGIAYIAKPWLESLTPYKVEPATDIGPGRFETGTQNFEALAGVIAAVNYLAQWGEDSAPLRTRLEQSYAQYNQHEQALSEHFLQCLEALPNARLYGIDSGDIQRRTPTFALRFDDADPLPLAKALGEQNICVWNGHFYALGLVKQLGLLESGGVLRVGLMHYNTKQEIDRLFEQLHSLVHRYR